MTSQTQRNVESSSGAASAYLATALSCLGCAAGLLDEIAVELGESASARGVRALRAQLQGAMRLIDDGHRSAS